MVDFNKPLKITILMGAFLPVPPIRGGAIEKLWYLLSKQFVLQGHRVFQISRLFDGLKSNETEDGVFHIRVQGFEAPGNPVWYKILDAVYTFRALRVIPRDSDIIITNTFWAPILLPSFLKRRCIVDVGRMPKGQLKFYGGVARFRANSKAVAAAVLREIGSGRTSKISLIPYSLPFTSFPHVSLGEKAKKLLYVGRIHSEKGIELLVRAAEYLDSAWEIEIIGPHEVRLGGAGPRYLNDLKSIAQKHNVVFSGPIFESDLLRKKYSEASIFVYPSLAESGETFGLAPLEAMAFGCVPVVSKLECFSDFIFHGINGMVFEHKSSSAVENLSTEISRIVKDDVYRLKLANEALKVRDTHSVNRVSDLLLSEMKKIVEDQS
jgi:glycosyltransferase involved in cell wall biosynthesis